ncbi:DUF1214 domain-containing protein [Cupriavidus pinatubonensis]|uniref:DUF1214 domain-containing protein n=1 Tax=Cupriavidus pinatubonensis TaxID=248026 RepID=UPI001C73C4BE|nr:DUF1214 domain-containing protein [Cupriavidus pinatubonensis]QYY29359.1 DUF1214 domain-containing protein [Cupriavidus pinatubonensis]
MRPHAALLTVTVAALLCACAHKQERHKQEPVPSASTTADQDVADAYVYLLGRLLVLRQEQVDFQKERFRWNEMRHRDVGGVSWANPNLDVVYSEAWIGVDERTCMVFSVPLIKGRYYTVQFLNGWGETVANINQRNYPQRAAARYGLCLKGASVELQPDVHRIDLPGKTARVLARVEIGKNRKQAVQLQRQIQIRMTGTPRIDPVPATPAFANTRLPGVEAFDSAALALDSEPDINPGMEPLQARVRQIAADVAADPAQRERIDRVIRDKAIPQFMQSLTTEIGTARNGWARPTVVGQYGSDYKARTRTNFAGIWANTAQEVVYFQGVTDGEGGRLNGANTYTMTFPKADLPAAHVRYFWSVIAVDAVNFRVMENPKKRYLLNKESRLQYGSDGSLTLYFAPAKPSGAPDGNWLPTPGGQDYHLTFRTYGPDAAVSGGNWYPPPMVRPR